MDARRERPIAAVSVPMSSGSGMSPSFGVAAPLGAVTRRTAARARRTALRREGPSRLLLRTALPGTVTLERRGADGEWEAIDRRRASRLGRTRLDLPQPAGTAPQTVRVVFAPRNPNVTAWVSDEITV